MTRAVRLFFVITYSCSCVTIASAQRPHVVEPSLGALNTNREMVEKLTAAMERGAREKRVEPAPLRFEPRLEPREPPRERPREEPVREPEVTVTPEPLSLGLIATGLVGLGALRRRRATSLSQ